MEEKEIITVCPEESELKYIGPTVCPTCNNTFPNSTACELHQIQKHKKESNFLQKKRKGSYRYFCPVADCKYSAKDLARHFTKMKYLKQHYLKSHAERKFACTDCRKTYPTQMQLTTHKAKECGIEFSCIQCNASYGSREALLTHCYRARHMNSILQTKRKGKIEFWSRGHPKKILPKPRASPYLMENIAAAALSELSRKAVVRTGIDSCTQTELTGKQIESRMRLKVESRDTGTSSSSTQTFPEADSDSLMTEMVLREYFTSATQTNQDMLFDDLGMFPDIDQHVNNETQTELIPSALMLDEECPALSDTHTQTADLDEYSHNCTQTCDDIFLNDFVELSDIETQTAWASLNVDSLLVSAQTQTLL